MVNRIVPQHDPAWGSVEVMSGDHCIGLVIHDGEPDQLLAGAAVLTPDGARHLARALEQQADSAEQVD